MATVTLPNGLKIDNISEESLKSILSGVEDGEHYNSSTHGRVWIKLMATPHLRNAILKALRESLEKARSYDTSNLVKYLRVGVGGESITILAMIKELEGRDLDNY
jgi:hypothetical protein